MHDAQIAGPSMHAHGYALTIRVSFPTAPVHLPDSALRRQAERRAIDAAWRPTQDLRARRAGAGRWRRGTTLHNATLTRSVSLSPRQVQRRREGRAPTPAPAVARRGGPLSGSAARPTGAVPAASPVAGRRPGGHARTSWQRQSAHDRFDVLLVAMPAEEAETNLIPRRRPLLACPR